MRIIIIRKSVNQITNTNALNQTSLTVYDGANRPFLNVQNWDGTPITAVNWQQACQFPPPSTDTNLCSVTFYDALGRRSASQDPMGNMITFGYDGLGRVITATRTLNQ
ncbi:MAG: RHS repeat protein, partial [Chloroflexi bacterium]|nr:RHS repeat protein [Chloroflexota bacterium]